MSRGSQSPQMLQFLEGCWPMCGALVAKLFPYRERKKAEGISKRYPDIGDRPKRVLSNPPEGPIEPLQKFYRTRFGSIEPPFGP